MDSFQIYNPPRKVEVALDQPNRDVWVKFFDEQYEKLVKLSTDGISTNSGGAVS